MAVNEEPESPSSENIISGGGIPSQEGVPASTIWKMYPFAQEWFEDAVRESRKPGWDHNARRREIVFAVCFAESYLYEWVHNEVLDSRDYGDLLITLKKLFPSDDKRPILDRWKQVTKELREDNFIPDAPNFGQSYWEEFRDLVKWRNGLVHARSSRPETPIQPEEEKPFPSKDDLDRLPAGWATRVVVTLVKRLHSAAETSPPDWLKMT